MEWMLFSARGSVCCILDSSVEAAVFLQKCEANVRMMRVLLGCAREHEISFARGALSCACLY